MHARRDNPLAGAVGATRSAAISRGLTHMDGSIGTLIAYATEPDTVALDGDGPHSPLTAALLDHIGTPGLEVRQMLARVRQQGIAAPEQQAAASRLYLETFPEGRFEGSASDSCLAGTDTIDRLGLTLLADGYGHGDSCPANF